MKKVISTDQAPAAIGPYSQAILATPGKGLLFISGQIPVDPKSGNIAGTLGEQTHQVMRNLEAILKEVGADFSNIVKTTCLLTTMDDFAEMNEIYGSYFESDPPARASFAVVKLPKGVLVEIEAVAVL